MIFSSHIIVLLLLTSLNQWHGIADYPLNLIYNKSRGLIEYKSSLPIVAPLPEYVTFNHYNTVKCDLLIIKNQFIIDVFLNDGRGSADTIRNLNR